MTITDPFAVQIEGFSGDFLKLDDFATGLADDGGKTGRLFLFRPSTVDLGVPGKTIDPKTGQPKPYDFATGTLVLLDGPTTTKVPEVPFVAENFRLSGGFIMSVFKRIFAAGQFVPGGRGTELTVVAKSAGQNLMLNRMCQVKNDNGSWSWSVLHDGGSKQKGKERVEIPFREVDLASARAYCASHPEIVNPPKPIDPFA